MAIAIQETSDVMIEFDHVDKRYGRVVAVDNVSFQVMRGEICGFLGPNGAGKTTSLRMLLGLIRPSAGRVLIQGIDVHKDTSAALEGVGAIIEESRFYPYLTGVQNLRQVLRLRGIAASESEIVQRLAAVGLADAARRRVKGYSLGMRQRLALALAALQDPVILVLDEPMNGLDPSAMRDFRVHLQALAQSGVTVLLSSHILSEVEQVADRLVFLNRGRVMAVEDRTKALGRTYIRALHPEALTAWAMQQNLTVQPLEDGAASVPVSDPAEVSSLIRAMVSARIDVVEVRPYAETLERQYLAHMESPMEVLQDVGE